MTEYTICGHKTDGMIISDNNILSVVAYLEWAESVGVFGTREVCWECWCKDRFNLNKLSDNKSKTKEVK